jgi:hypothetical protein
MPAPVNGRAVPHSHSPDGELHIHSPSVDALLTLAEPAPGEAVDSAPPTVQAIDPKVPAAFAWSQSPSSERVLLFFEANRLPRSNSPMPRVPPPRG